MKLRKEVLLEIAHYINKGGRMNLQQSETIHYVNMPQFDELRENDQLRRALVLALHYEMKVEALGTDIAQLSRHGTKMIIEDAFDPVTRRLIEQRDAAVEEYEFMRRMIDADNEYLQFDVTEVKIL